MTARNAFICSSKPIKMESVAVECAWYVLRRREALMAASDVPNSIAGSDDADVDEMGTHSGGVDENGPGVCPGKTVASADDVSMGGPVAVAVDDRVDAD
jgi:hypothetical protein